MMPFLYGFDPLAACALFLLAVSLLGGLLHAFYDIGYKRGYKHGRYDCTCVTTAWATLLDDDDGGAGVGAKL